MEQFERALLRVQDIFTDETHFHLDGLVQQQNCCISTLENPQVHVEKQMHSQRATVGCRFWVARRMVERKII